MKTGTKLGLILGGALLVIGFVVIAAGVAFTVFSVSSGTQRARELYKKRTGQTDGKITNVSLTTASKIYTFKYEINGTPYSGTQFGVRSKVENNYEKDVGKKVTVCYDPSDPSSSDFSWSEFYEYGDKKGEKMICGVPSK